MEFKNVPLCCVILSGVFLCLTQGNRIETQGRYTEYMSRVPTLTCKFVTTDDSLKWIFMRWNRINKKDNTSKPLAILTSQNAGAEWIDTVPAHFKDHVHLKSEVKDGTISFDMRIDGFRCSDAGRYKCEIFTYDGDLNGFTDLVIEAHPGTPVITEDIIEVPENATFNLECKANVGIPPQELRWAYKMQEQETYMQMTKNVTHEVRPTADCTFQEISKVTLVMTPELDGTVFLCSSRGELGEKGTPMNYDEVTVIIHRPPTTTITQLPSTVIIIDDNDPNAAISSSSSIGLVLCVSVLSIVTVLSRGS